MTTRLVLQRRLHALAFYLKSPAGYFAKANRGPVAGLLACAVLTGCAVGPRSLDRDYPRYSQTIREIQDEHLLLNLVRLRYLETPVFLQVTSLTTTYEINVAANAAATGGGGAGAVGGGGIGGGYRETPTFTYSLPDSREFFGRMVARLSAAQLAPLAMTGVGGYFRLGLSRINGLENVSVYSGKTVKEPASYAQFDEALRLLLELEREGLIDFTYNISSRVASSPFEELGEHSSMPDAQEAGMEFWRNADDQWVAHIGRRVPFLRLAAASTKDPRGARLRELLNLDPQKYSFPLVDVDFSTTELARLRGDRPAAALDPEAKFGEVVIVNRSMFQILGIAARSVQVPDEHVQAGIAMVDEDALGDMLTIKSSKKKPSSAAVAVRYKGVWFYIAANDLNSKMTLVRLHSLFEVTAGRVSGADPILTIPVN